MDLVGDKRRKPGATLYMDCPRCRQTQWGMYKYVFHKGNQKTLIWVCSRCGIKVGGEELTRHGV